MSLNQLNDFLYTYRMSLPAACKSCTVSLANPRGCGRISGWRTISAQLRQLLRRRNVLPAFDGSLVTDLNRWVSKKTDGMIDRLLEQAPDALTMLYLVNAALL